MDNKLRLCETERLFPRARSLWMGLVVHWARLKQRLMQQRLNLSFPALYWELLERGR